MKGQRRKSFEQRGQTGDTAFIDEVGAKAPPEDQKGFPGVRADHLPPRTEAFPDGVTCYKCLFPREGGKGFFEGGKNTMDKRREKPVCQAGEAVLFLDGTVNSLEDSGNHHGQGRVAPEPDNDLRPESLYEAESFQNAGRENQKGFKLFQESEVFEPGAFHRPEVKPIPWQGSLFQSPPRSDEQNRAFRRPFSDSHCNGNTRKEMPASPAAAEHNPFYHWVFSFTSIRFEILRRIPTPASMVSRHEPP